MTEGLVSIIMPSWNTEKYIGEAIRSVLGQSYTKWELLIVDDGSTDHTDEIVGSFADPRIKYYKNSENCGAALSRNRAIREAKGEWVAFLDSDDLWAPDKLKKQIAFMQEKKCDFSYHEYEKVDEDNKPLHIYVSGPYVVNKKMMYHYGYPGCLTFMYNAGKMGLIQIEDIKKNNDYAILLLLCKKADCYLLKENLAQYRVRKKSISHDSLRKKVRSHYDLFRKCDKQPVFKAFWYACWNMWYGILKKWKYENRYGE